ncbi:MAG: hypothetical protein Q8Q33_02010 [Chlamydiota bacterium]|nr:hypothetical protein [Chlamydiota bacterium]
MEFQFSKKEITRANNTIKKARFLLTQLYSEKGILFPCRYAVNDTSKLVWASCNTYLNTQKTHPEIFYVTYDRAKKEHAVLLVAAPLSIRINAYKVVMHFATQIIEHV